MPGSAETMAEMLKAITIRQPYAQLVMIGAKAYEFRTWHTKYRGPLVIHAGAAVHAVHSRQWRESKAVLQQAGYLTEGQLPLGSLLGVVDMVDCIRCDQQPLNWRHPPAHCGDFDAEMFAFVFERPRLLRVPIPAKGKLNLWNVDRFRGVTKLLGMERWCPRCKRHVSLAWDGLTEPTKWTCGVCRLPLTERL